MCGIAGIINIRKSAGEYVAPLGAMTKRMQNRGPDDEGYLFISPNGTMATFYGEDTPHLDHQEAGGIAGFPNRHINSAMGEQSVVALGHRRLSIVDLSPAGHQPMATSDLRYWIVYNGEVYNYQEIATDLAQEGIQLRSSSDTEVILYSYALWGPSCLERFNGMFAFAIWDNQERVLFCARDRIGIKPFYYTMVDGQFIFASDIKTIIASGLYRPEPDMEGLYLSMAFGIAPRPKTAFKGIRALEQAHWLKIGIGGRMEKQRYWSIPVGTQQHDMTENEAAELLEEQLIRAIRYRLVADVPVGTFMSGGIDSTTISAIASALHPGIKAFTLGYEDNAPEFDEVEQARATAAMHSMEHIIQTVRPDDTLQYLDAWVDGYEEPFYHLAANFVISKIVKDDGVTVVLNGLGGDELFAGYSYYTWASRYWLMRVLSPMISLGSKLLTKYNVSRYASRLALMKQATTPDRLHTVLFVKTPDSELQRLFVAPELKDFSTIDYLHDLYVRKDTIFADPLEAFSFMDLTNYIGNHHVHRSDQFTMAHSIEGRFPFLDHNLVEAAFCIPGKYKIHGKIQKYILRKVAGKYIAPQCLAMKKKGFGLPLEQWLQGPLARLVKSRLPLLKEREIFDSGFVSNCLHMYKSGRYSSTRIWHLVMLELWFERFIEGKNGSFYEAF